MNFKIFLFNDMQHQKSVPYLYIWDIETQINSLLKKINKTKTKISEFRKLEEWKVVSNCKDERFPEKLKKFLTDNKIHINFVSLNLKFFCKGVPGLSNYENMVEFSKSIPFLVISEERISHKNFSNHIGKNFFKYLSMDTFSLDSHFNDDGYSTSFDITPILKNKEFSIREFNSETYPYLFEQYYDEFIKIFTSEAKKVKIQEEKDFKNSKSDFDWLGFLKLMFFGEMYKFTWVTLIVIACLIISFTSDYTPSSSDGFDNNKLRNAAEQLYDNCQRYGKSFDPRC